MALAPLTESDIIEQIYAMYENDNDTWSATSAEYLTARTLCKAGIIRWEFLEGVQWPELFTKLSAAADGTKTITAGDYDYTCPTDMRLPPQAGDYVRLLSGTSVAKTLLIVPPSKISQLNTSDSDFCYFTGNQKAGFVLNINPNLLLTTGNTIEYEYYRRATYFTTTTSSTEMSNPMFIVHYVLHRLYKSDGQLSEAGEELQVAEGILQQMRSDAFIVDEDSLSSSLDGFGE